jgi:hypothetical protein
MNIAIFIWTAVVLFSSTSTSQGRRTYEDESVEMIFKERDFSSVARRVHRYSFESVAKRLSLKRRK